MGGDLSTGLHRFAVVTAISGFVLVVAGALVTSHDAGLSVPDWPLSHGSLMPEMIGGIFYEHSHRLIATTVGLLTIILAVWLHRSEPRPWVRRFGWLALGMVVVQGILGGITVLFFLPTAVSVAHACLGQIFFSSLVTVAYLTSDSGQGDHSLLQKSDVWRRWDRPMRLASITFLVIFIQLMLGAILRHAGTVAGSKGAILVTSALLPHLLWALVVGGFVVGTVRAVVRQSRSRAAARVGYFLVCLFGLQLFLGLGAYWARIVRLQGVQPFWSGVLVTTTHVSVGALILAGSLILSLSLARQQSPIEQESAEKHLDWQESEGFSS